jgi:hypothetical protein
MSTAEAHPAERRVSARRPVLLPIRVSFLRGPDRERVAPAGAGGDALKGQDLPQLGAIYALALDVSERGMQVELSGAVAKTFLSAIDVMASVQVGFVHKELRRLGDHIARVQWSRTASERDACVLGLKFDKAFDTSAVEAMVRCGPVFAAPESNWKRTAVFGVGGVLLFGAVLFGLRQMDRADELSRAMLATEKDRSEARRLLDDCAAVKRPSPSGPVVEPPAATAPSDSAATDAGAPHTPDTPF